MKQFMFRTSFTDFKKSLGKAILSCQLNACFRTTRDMCRVTQICVSYVHFVMNDNKNSKKQVHG